MSAAVQSAKTPRGAAKNARPKPSTRRVERGLWSREEHDKFLEGLKLFPRGPWKKIAGFVGSRSARQVQTHAQKYYEKVGRRLRGLRKDRKKLVRPEHRLDDDMIKLCRLAADKDAPLPLSSCLEDPPALAREIASALKTQSSWSMMAAAKEEPSVPPLLDDEENPSFQAMLSALQIHVHEPATCEYVRAAPTQLDLSDMDDSYLDFLIEVLDCAPPESESSWSATTGSDVASVSSDLEL